MSVPAFSPGTDAQVSASASSPVAAWLPAPSTRIQATP